MARAKLEVIIEAQNQAKRQLDNLSSQLRKVAGDQENLAIATEESSQSFASFASSVGVGVLAANLAERAILATGRALKNFVSSSIETALSVERVSATLPVLARNTGKTTQEINKIIFAIRNENKSILEATEITRGIVLAGLDEVAALKLLAVARDVGATVGRNSADVNRLILESFTTLTPGVLKTLGLNISLRTTYRDLSEQLGKNIADLTTTERQQGLLNAIMKEGEKFAGAYDAAMTTVQKVTNSVKDASADLQFVFGSLLTDGFFPIVSQALGMIRVFRAWAITSDNELNPALQRIAEAIGTTLNVVFNTLLDLVSEVRIAFRELKANLEALGIIEGISTAFKLLATIWREAILPLLIKLNGDSDNFRLIIQGLMLGIAALIVVALVPLALAMAKATVVVIAIIAVVRVLKAVFTALFFTAFELARVIEETWTKIKFRVTNSVTAMIESVTRFFLTVKRFFFAIGVILGIFNDSVVFAREFLIQNFGQMGVAIVRLAETFRIVFDAIKSFLANTWDSIVNTATRAIDTIIAKVQSAISSITAIPRAIASATAGAFSRARSFVGLAEGGIVRRPTAAIIGEAGPEAVIPLNRLGAAGGLGGTNIIVNINGNVFSDDAERLMNTIGDSIIDRLGLNIRIG